MRLGAVDAATSPTFITISRGSSGFPVVLAGHTLVQRPHTVQASVSKICFQVRSDTTEALIDSMSVASIRFGSSFIAPLGRSRGARNMLAGEVSMCLSLVVGRITRNHTNVSTWKTQKNWCHPVAAASGNSELNG